MVPHVQPTICPATDSASWQSQRAVRAVVDSSVFEQGFIDTNTQELSSTESSRRPTSTSSQNSIDRITVGADVDAARTDELVEGVNYNQTGAATAVFEDIAKNNRWGHRESISGDGSSLDNTGILRACLANWFIIFDIDDFVDVPCGDGNWQGAIPGIGRDPKVRWHKDLRWVRYRGFDISPTAVEVPGKRMRRTATCHSTSWIFQHVCPQRQTQ